MDHVPPLAGYTELSSTVKTRMQEGGAQVRASSNPLSLMFEVCVAFSNRALWSVCGEQLIVLQKAVLFECSC